MIPVELASARWFRSKQRQIADIREVDRAPVGPGALVVLDVSFSDRGGSERYLVPMVDGREPRDGDGLWSALAEAIGREARIGSFVATRAAGFEPGTMDERRLNVEQSNTSVVLGERLILKVYRLLEPGENPDVEVSAFLTDVGFGETPAVAGHLTYVSDGDRAAAAMLQEYVPSTGDGWAAMLDALADDPDRATRMAVEVGALTARMHAALASRPTDPAFPARLATHADSALWRASAESQLTQALAALSGDARARLEALAPSIRARFDTGFGFASRDEPVTRIHGDYHLGQLLARTDGGLSVIDFEGEPARPLDERRKPSSPLRDVAGMLRSLDYAARTVERRAPVAAVTWLPEAREAFLGAYGAARPALEAFELEKALYEVRYEANNRPDWLWLPLRAIGRLAA
jgi:trehalose synthase-fused probable maltokinase